MQTNVFHTITRLIILIPLQCHGDSERKKERKRGGETVGEGESFFRNRDGDEGGREGGRKRGREHIRLRDLQWLYISQCLVKAARQGSGNLIIA